VLAGLLTEIGMPMTPEQSIETFMGRSWKTVVAWADERGGLPDGFRRRYLDGMFAAFAEELRPVPGIVGALDAITLPDCVASSASIEKMRLTLGLTGLLARFEGRIFSATDVPNGKPAPDLFLHAARGMGFAPADCVVLEDSPPGAEAARRAGMRCVAIPYVPGTVDDPAFSSAGLLFRGGQDEFDAKRAYSWITG